jgi:hypothetical protein
MANQFMNPMFTTTPQTSALQGRYPINLEPIPAPTQLPTVQPGPINPDWLNQEWLKPKETSKTAEGSGAAFTLPGYKSSVKVPQAPDMTKITKAIDNLKAPGKKRTDAMATIMEALANTPWNDRSAVGTNLFNIGAQLMAAGGKAKKEELAAQDAAEQASTAFELKKLQLEQAAQQQDYSNQMLAANMGMKVDEFNNKGMAPKVVGNSILYGVKLPSGDIQYKTQKVGESKFDRVLKYLQQTSKNATADITHAVQTGQVPPQFSQVLGPAIVKYQAQALQELGGQLALADDKTKQQMINMQVNNMLRADPQLGPIVKQLDEPLKNQAIYQEALKRGL